MVSSDIPPVSPARPNAAQQPAAGTPARLVVAEVTVEKAPTELYQPQPKIHIEGKVVASDAQKSEIRIATANGEVVVKSATPLPVEADVALDLYLQKGQLVANIHLIRNAAPTATAASPSTVATPALPAEALPPLTAGSTLTAVFVPKDTPPPVTSAFLPQAQLEAALTQLASGGWEALPDMPAPLKALMATTDPLTAFRNLPLTDQQAVSAYFTKPDAMAALQDIMALSAAADPADANLLQIVRAQLSARLTQEALQSGTSPSQTAPAAAMPSQPSAAATPSLALVRSILPLIGNMAGADVFPVFNAGTGTGASSLPLLQQALTSMAAQMPQNMHEIRIAGIQPALTSAGTATINTTPDPAPAAGQISGKIESFTPKGFPVLNTDSGFFIVHAKTDAPVGSTVLFSSRALTPEQFLSPAATSTASHVTNSATFFDPLTAFHWPALDEMLDVAAALLPETTATLRDSLPAPAAKMAPTVLFFLAALRTGLIENWLGQTAINTLRAAGKKELIERLAGDFAKLSSQSKTELPGDWRVISVPLRHDEQISQMQFFLRQQPDPEAKDDTSDGPHKPLTRFVLNVHMSRLGDVQLDGLMQHKRLDVILRTADRLPEDARREILQRFSNGLDQTGMQGGISFQTRSEGWVTPQTADHHPITA